VFVLGAVMVFATTVRTFGLAVAGPLAIIISSLADRQTRPIEVLLFAIGLTAICIGLFKYLLRLPIPLAPFYLGY
jgi:CHASE2 domain-containing sensor protein